MKGALQFGVWNSASSVKKSVEQSIELARTSLRAARDLKSVDSALTTFFNSAMPVQFLRLVSVNDEVRAAATESLEMIEKFELEVARDEELYKAVVKNNSKDDDAQDVRARQLYARDFELRGGVHLSAEKRSSLSQLRDRVVELQGLFSKNIADDASHVVFTREDLDGLDDAFLGSLERTADGGYVVTLRYPHANPVMQLAKSGATRKRMWQAVSRKAAATNTDVLPKIVDLRLQIAHLLGFSSDAQVCFSHQQRMAGEQVEDVDRFLERIEHMIAPKKEEEIEALKAIKREVEPGSVDLFPWDISFLLNLRMKREFDVDHQLVKEYFPLDHVVEGVFSCYSKLLGLNFVRDDEAEKASWHPSVRAYRVHDAGTQEFLARFYLDLHPRTGKYTHAACWWLQKRGQEANSHPTVCMVTNFTEPTKDRPALLRFSEVETFFHEFGHVCHACLSNARYQRLNWTWKAVEMDFLEVPSMCFEKFVFDANILRLLSKHYQSSEPLPEHLRRGLVRARNASDGWAWTRLISMARVDFRMHSSSPGGPDDWTKQQAHQLRTLFHVKLDAQDEHPSWASWDHMVTGYNASYYSYLWSEVTACALFNAFEECGDFLNPQLGAKLRKTVLEPCASLTGREMVRNFLGKDASEEAFRKSIFEKA